MKLTDFSESFWDFTEKPFYDVIFLDHDLFKKMFNSDLDFKKIFILKVFWILFFKISRSFENEYFLKDMILIGYHKSNYSTTVVGVVRFFRSSQRFLTSSRVIGLSLCRHSLWHSK